jgi:hypothetical protein
VCFALKNLDSKEQVITILDKIIKKEKNDLYPVLLKELADTGKMTNGEVQNILSLTQDLNGLQIEVLEWLYSAITKNRDDLKPVEEYFTEKEIKQAEIFQIKRSQSEFPLHFKILDRLLPHEDYLITLSIKEINNLQEKGIIILDPEMQRESEIANYHNQLVSHISYSDSRAREIGEDMATNEYHADPLRWILVDNDDLDYYIDETKNELVIKSGDIALIDGNHRTRGGEYALRKNVKIDLRLPIIISIGTVKVGQKIINQSEKRQPLNKEFVKTYDDSPESNIVKYLATTDDLDEVYKFCKTKDEINKDYGFILESSLASYIKKWYDLTNASKKQENKIKKWLVEFLNSMADYFSEDFRNFSTIKKFKWNVSYFTVAGYIYLSSILQDVPNWESKLEKILTSIDFGNANRPWKEGVSNADRLVEQYFEGVVNNVLG